MSVSRTHGGESPSGYQFAFLDSGTGGLPYMMYLKEAYPSASCVYLADTLHFPYGEKSREQIISYAVASSRLLIEKFSPQAVVVACNTMSVTALSALRGSFDVPFVGTVPAIKLAASVSRSRRIGLLATNRTVSEPYTEQLVSRFAADCTVVRRGDSPLVSFIESRLAFSDRSERLEAVRPAVDFFAAHSVDTIILGCTHFVHVADEIRELAGSGVQVVDSREGVVRQALTFVSRGNAPVACAGPDQAFYITGVPPFRNEDGYAAVASRLGLPWMGVLQ